MCRTWAAELSTLKPQLDAHGVGLVAVGLEELGIEEFVEGKFFKGDLYIDQNYTTYKALGYGRASLLSVPGLLVAKETRQANARGNVLGITGNMKGDGLQKGGTNVIEKGGKILLAYQQKGFGDHPKLEDILNALGIKGM